MFDEKIKYPYQFSGFTVYENYTVCNTCGSKDFVGLIPMALHWNDCVDKGKTLNALKKAYTQKGNSLSVEDVDKIIS